MREQQGFAMARSVKQKAIDQFLEKVHSAMTDLEFDVDPISEDATRDWNHVLRK